MKKFYALFVDNETVHEAVGEGLYEDKKIAKIDAQEAYRYAKKVVLLEVTSLGKVRKGKK